MIKLLAITALVLLVSVPVPGENLPTDSHYLIFHAYDAEDRIYDLADLTFSTSNGLNEPHISRTHCGGGYYDRNTGYVITASNGPDGNAAYKTVLLDALAGAPNPSSDIDDWGLAFGRYCGAPDGTVWNRHLSGQLETVRFDFDTNSVHNPPDWGHIGGARNGGNRERYLYNGSVYEINHDGGIWKITWNGIYGDMSVGPWDTPVQPGYITSRWTGYNGALDGNGILYGGPGDGSTVHALDLDVVGRDTLVATLPGVRIGNVNYQRSIQNDAGDIQVNTEGTTLYISGRLIGANGSPLQSHGFFGTYDMINDTYSPLVDGVHPPDLSGGIQDSWRLTYIDLRDGAGPVPSEVCDNNIDDDGDGDADCDDSDCSEAEICQEPAGVQFVRGDSNGDTDINISDASFTLRYLFQGGREPACQVALDANGDNRVDISDAVFTLGFLFLGGRQPPAPYPECGVDAAEETPGCEASPGNCQ